jgi:NAD(P)-dependent dehydrogenase (short-subunit alcohol dehydrogenase family)
MPDLSGKHFVVTGSSSGMGFKVAEAIVEKNGNVIVASRNQSKNEKAVRELQEAARNAGKSPSIEAMELDLTSFRSINTFVDNFKKKRIPLHCLVNNAGVFLVPHDHTQEGFETTVGTNYYGHMYLTHLLMDKVQQSKPARIVFMASLFETLGVLRWNDLEMHESKESGVFEYATSKLMIIMLARELNKRLKGTDVEVFSAQPGLIKSPLYEKVDWRKASTVLMWLGQFTYGIGAGRGCLPLLRAATDPSLKGRGGSYFSPPFVYVLPFHINQAGSREPNNVYARDEKAWKRLYEETLQIVNKRAKEKGLPTISAVGQKVQA